MTSKEAQDILSAWIEPDGALRGNPAHVCDFDAAYIQWSPGSLRVMIDGACTASQLSAIVTWMTDAGIARQQQRASS